MADPQQRGWNDSMDGRCSVFVFVVWYILGYQEALAKFTLKKFLLLVLFLDKAKTAHLIGYNPCLFCKDSDYKVCSW